MTLLKKKKKVLMKKGEISCEKDYLRSRFFGTMWKMQF